MPIDKNKPFDPEYYDEDGSMFEDEILIDEEHDEEDGARPGLSGQRSLGIKMFLEY